MAGRLDNLVMQIVERFMAERFTERHGLVTSYDPKTYMGKVTLQPEGQETGWIRIEADHVGQGYGLMFGLQPGSGKGGGEEGGGATGGNTGSGGTGSGGGSGQGQGQGDQVMVRFQEGDLEGGKISKRIHSNQDKPPVPVQAGEAIMWTKFKQDKNPGPDAADSGQSDSDGQTIYFKNDGSISTTDGNGAIRTMDGKGNYTVIST